MSEMPLSRLAARACTLRDVYRKTSETASMSQFWNLGGDLDRYYDYSNEDCLTHHNIIAVRSCGKSTPCMICTCKCLSFSIASDAFDISSRKKTSLSV